MKLAIRFFVVGVFFLNASIISAQFFDGNKIYDYWKSFNLPTDQKTDTDMYKAAYFMGYVTAVYDSSANLIIKDTEGVTVQQLCDIAGKYLDDHPEKRHESAFTLILAALRDAFPLKQSHYVERNMRKAQ